MIRITTRLSILCWAISAVAALAQAAAPIIPHPQITIVATGQTPWLATYRFDRPVRKLIFDRSPDGSRMTSWMVMPGFQITRDDDGTEVASRIDGKPFRQIEFRVPPRYRDLTKDYAPFAPFGDGGVLFHTGRFFACAEICSTQASKMWQLRLIVRDGRQILLNEQRHRGSVRWTDGDDGRNVYLGRASVAQGSDVSAVIDRALPPLIRQQLDRQIPVFMRYFATRLGALDFRPTLFASYDAAHVGGWGRQGGTLPRQIFIHFYGNRWPQEFDKPDFANELAWHFAHEAGHLYQRGLSIEATDGWWIHEGGADAFAAIAMRQSGPDTARYVDQRVAATRQSCPKLLDGRSLHEATSRKVNEAAYQCGLLLNLALDHALRKQMPDRDGLYAVWRAYLARATAGKAPAEADFLASIADVGGTALAERVKRLVDSPNPDFTTL